ncbi:hypothetical protein [Bosea sp. (in: a-proteobacteria)]|uniref:hypothetical protein n=1 Tax=Bosea sp. (in: a-proteobacteria) TaxID=1871050 RepID=UPI00086B20FE|nr:hypothetical protein [Bosea sp. (in: a-proteobacteria)]MBN9440526.1 hypothetical protein [Bosea sp. (in: a-proteobacteria)]ODT43378.1 MAG: hypothetical protein ABS59_23685 [Methylobacterium sp. SCN 67-24]
MVLFDATTLLLLFSPNAGVPTDSEGNIITFPKERIDGLVAALTKARTKIVIPTPALSEMLVHAGQVAGAGYLTRIRKASCFRIEAFDEVAAVEVALMTKAAKDNGDKKAGSNAVWAKVKYDRQIVAIGKVRGVTTIYSDDEDVRTIASGQGLKVTSVAELPVPDAAAQQDWVDELERSSRQNETAESK